MAGWVARENGNNANSASVEVEVEAELGKKHMQRVLEGKKLPVQWYQFTPRNYKEHFQISYSDTATLLLKEEPVPMDLPTPTNNPTESETIF